MCAQYVCECVCLCVQYIFFFLCLQQPPFFTSVQCATFLKCLILSARSRCFPHFLHPHCLANSLAAWLPIRSFRNTPSSSWRERGGRNGGLALAKSANEKSQKKKKRCQVRFTKTPGSRERRFVCGATSPPSCAVAPRRARAHQWRQCKYLNKLLGSHLAC